MRVQNTTRQPWTSVSAARQSASPQRHIDLGQYAFVQIGCLTRPATTDTFENFWENHTKTGR